MDREGCLLTVRYPSAGLFVGGYEHEERQTHPLVAMDFSDVEEAKEAARWLTGMADQEVILKIVSAPEGDLQVLVATTAGETVCEGEVWKDEMWRIFMEYYRQGEAVLFAVSLEESVLAETLCLLPEKAVLIQE